MERRYLDYDYRISANAPLKRGQVYLEMDTLSKVNVFMMSNQMYQDFSLTTDFFSSKDAFWANFEETLNKSEDCWDKCKDQRGKFWCRLGCIGKAIAKELIAAVVGAIVAEIFD
ncbi:MAG: hypothetical protein HC913_14590 [Microscillaceae bacterium]|nr:hypothetical protein [Microscillaceae bacterium]